MNESYLLFFTSAKIKGADGNNNPTNKLAGNRKTSETGKTKKTRCDLTNNDAAATSTFVYYSIHMS